MVAEADADAPPRDVLAAALEADERLAQRAEELRADNARLREELARRGAELDRVNAELAVLQRLYSAGPRSGCGPMPQVAGTRAAIAPAAVTAEGSAARGRRQAGGTTRICPGSR